MDYLDIFSSVSFDIRCTNWSCEDNKIFEECLTVDCIGDMDECDRINQLYQMFSGRKTLEEIQIHYRRLVYDINKIESGMVLFPDQWYDENNSHIASTKIRTSTKGQQWTQDEHRLFLIGEKLFGKGDWRSISRLVVISRCPSQVASHAQKYYIKAERAKAEKAGVVKLKKRSSIHDITTIDVNDIQALHRKGLFEDDRIQQEILRLLAFQQQSTPNSSNTSNSLGVLDSISVQQQQQQDSPGVLASSSVQQVYTPKSEPMITSGSVQQSPYTPDYLGVHASGRVQPHVYTPKSVSVIDSGSFQQPPYKPDTRGLHASSSKVQQQVYTPNSVPVITSGSVQQFPYTPDSLGVHASGRVQQVYTPNFVPVITSCSVQQSPYTPDSLGVHAFGEIQQVYTPNSEPGITYGSVQQPLYTLDSLGVHTSGQVQQQFYTPNSLEALAFGRVQPQGFTPAALAFGRVQQQAYTPGALPSSRVQQQAYTPGAFEPGRVQQKAA